MAMIVEGDLYKELDGKLFEIKRQLRQPNGYPFSPYSLSRALQRVIEGDFGEKRAPLSNFTEGKQEHTRFLDLGLVGPTFADWLNAREEIHKFLTGETIKLREIFEMGSEIFTRTDIMPFFRPAGATNRLAMEWKVKFGMNKPYEEVDVMRYSNADGPKVPQLGFIARSVKPDANTLGKQAKSPRDLAKMKMKENQAWLNLFGYADADNLHFLITGKHIDLETWTWLVMDRLHPGLPDGNVVDGYWPQHVERSWFSCSDPGRCFPSIGARLAELFPLKTP